MFETLSSLKTKTLCVIGDFMLDSYTRGSVKRISPEAPVCVLKVKKEERHPGGAGNVALNCKALGAEVFVIGRYGDDLTSEYLKKSLTASGVHVDGLFFEEDYETPLKNRIMADHQQLLRIDFERDQPLLETTSHQVMDYLEKHIAKFDLLLISDYNKGFLSRDLLNAVIDLAVGFDVPVFVDPKGHDFSKYRGVTLIKPNLSEAYQASVSDENTPLDDVAAKLLNASKAEHLLITRSEKGMSLFSDGGRMDFAACAKEVIDVTGAGDTVLATLAVSYASGIGLARCIDLANLAASCAIEKSGCVHVGKKELVKAISRVEAKCKFLPHLGEELIPLLFAGEKIIPYVIDPLNLNFELLTELSVLKSENPDRLIAAIIPDDLSEVSIKGLCELLPLDLVVPLSLKGLLEPYYVPAELLMSV